ncbi:PQQ-dependent sugar dehydrogenase [Alphaproteobacteria bacterium]|nr:PQQ-dependent sugar dehydrogenase [Alphaproteobacteria bacterium]
METIKSQLHNFRVTTIARGLDHPWSMAFLPDGGLLITERVGRLRLYRGSALSPKPIAGVPRVVVSGQGGLLDVTLHPQFSENRLLYLSYAARGTSGVHTRVSRFYFDAASHALIRPKLIFDATPKVHGGRHFGGRMVFDRAGYLFISVGERGDMNRAQTLTDHSGSIIRLNKDGGVPPDNPFIGRGSGEPEIYSYGHRNPQGMALNPRTGAVWTHEHGAKGGDEVNIIHSGRNYGWPVITHGINYDNTPIGIGKEAPGMEQPLYYWVPSIAPSGMAFYTGEKFPRWRNSLFVGALRGELLVRLELDGDRVIREERLLTDRIGRIRDVRIGSDGMIYLATDDDQGCVLRLEPVD